MSKVLCHSFIATYASYEHFIAAYTHLCHVVTAKTCMPTCNSLHLSKLSLDSLAMPIFLISDLLNASSVASTATRNKEQFDCQRRRSIRSIGVHVPEPLPVASEVPLSCDSHRLHT
jgi:hypothetical protein